MAIYREDFVDIDLAEKSIHRSFLTRTIGEGDQLANRFGVRVLRNGEAVAIGGTCAGYFIRPSGDTVVITGTVSGNTAYVELPKACYTYEGQFALAIKVTSGSATGTMRIIDGVVANTTTDTLVDPGTIIPTIDALLASIEAAVETIPLDYSALSNSFRDSIATEFGLSDPGTFTTNTIKRSDGTVTTSTVYKVTDYIPVTGKLAIYTTTPATNSTVLNERASIAFYSTDSASGYISSEAIQSGSPTSIIWQSTSIPDNAKYFRIMIGKDLTDLFKCIQVFSVVDAFGDVNDELGRISNETTWKDDAITYKYKKQYIGLSGTSVTMSGGEPSITGASVGYDCDYAACSAGDVFTINGVGGSGTQLWAFVSSDGTILSKSGANVTGDNEIITAPTNAAFLITHTNNGSTSYKGEHYKSDFIGKKEKNGNICQLIDIPLAAGSGQGQYRGVRSTITAESDSLKFTCTGSTQTSFGGYAVTMAKNRNGHRFYYMITGIDYANVSNIERITIGALNSSYGNITTNTHTPAASVSGMIEIPAANNVFGFSIYAGLSGSAVENDWFSVGNVQIFDLTEMFGAGYEPTEEQFLAIYQGTSYPMQEALHIEERETTVVSNRTAQNVFNIVSQGTGILPAMWETGGLSISTGQPSTYAFQVCRTYNYIPVTSGELIYFSKPDSGYVLYALEYGESKNFLRSKSLSNAIKPNYRVGDSTKYIRLFAHLSTGTTGDFTTAEASENIILYRNASGVAYNPDASFLGLHTMPENNGVMNAIKRARQMTDVEWSPAVDIDRVSLLTSSSYSGEKTYYTDKFLAGVKYRGIPYSDQQPYVADEASIDSFVTAAANANSAESLESSYVNRNVASFYGSSCATFVSYALNLPLMASTYYHYMDGVTKKYDIYADGAYHELNSLELCDIILRTSHVALVTDIIKDDNGNVTHIEVSESTKYGGVNLSEVGGQYGGICRRKMWTLAEFRAWFSDFAIYKYSGLSSIPYREFDYTDIPGEGKKMISAKLPVIPYRGNNSFVYSEGSSVTVKLLIASTGFTHISLKRNGAAYGEGIYQLSGTGEFNVSCPAAGGRFTAHLCNVSDGAETTTSIDCEWIVISNDVSHSYSVSGSNVTFTIVRYGNLGLPERVEFDGSELTATRFALVDKSAVTVTNVGNGQYKYEFTVKTTHTSFTKYLVRWDFGKFGTAGKELVTV